MNQENDQETTGFSRWMKGLVPIPENQKDTKKTQTEPYVENRPIEPKEKKLNRPSIFRWIILLLVIAYVILYYYRVPILTCLGSYLIVQHTPAKADLIVFTIGKPIERGLTAAELYKKGLAQYIFITREELPDAYTLLEGKKAHYPETKDLVVTMLQGLGVPRAACIIGDRFSGNTFEEAKIVRELVQNREYQSLIIVTSPLHSRRVWMTFKRVFGKDEVKIIVVPSQYTNFRADNWWKTRKYDKEVFYEYLKLLYFTIKSKK